MTPKVFVVIFAVCLFSTCEARFKRKKVSSMPMPDTSMANPKDRLEYIPKPGQLGNPFSAKKKEDGLMGGSINGTEFVDKVLGAAHKEMEKMGLALIKPQDIEFEFSLPDSAPGDVCKAGLYEAEIRGVTNFRRTKDVTVDVELATTKIKSAFEFFNISYVAGVEIDCPKKNLSYDNGHIKIACDNVTLDQVWKLTHATRNIVLEEFEISIGDCKAEVSDLGKDGDKVENFINQAIEKMKPTLTKAFNISFKMAVNIGLQVARAMLIAATTG